MNKKQRLSASVDADLLKAAERAVAKGKADSISAWVNEALSLKLAQNRQLEALAAFVKAHEAEHGEITPEEMQLATRSARARAVPVRGISRRNKTTARRNR